VTLTDPELIKDVLNKISDFRKPEANPLAKLLATGLVNYDGEKWNKHRRLINPAFSLEKLKVSFPLLDEDLLSNTLMLEKHSEIGFLMCVSHRKNSSPHKCICLRNLFGQLNSLS